MIITIDGPMASGKSTVAQKIAHKNKMYYINSGYLYRAFAYAVIHNPDVTPHQFLAGVRYVYDTEPHVFWHDEDITAHLKEPLIDSMASKLSTSSHVREAVTQLQRKLADDFDVVIDGRDCGSVVFPHAAIKFYLTASVEERARRWNAVQNFAFRSRGMDVLSYEEAKQKIIERDTRDMTRAISPLRKPEGAVVIDSTKLSLNEVCDTMQQYIESKLRSPL